MVHGEAGEDVGGGVQWCERKGTNRGLGYRRGGSRV